MENSRIDFLKALSSALDSRDSYTEGHSLRVAGISLEIGKEMHLKQKELDILYQAGLFRDIGKIGVPDNILKNQIN